MNALMWGCVGVTALCWGGALVLLAAVWPQARTAGITPAMRWRQVRPDVWTLGVVGALFGLTALALGVLG